MKKTLKKGLFTLLAVPVIVAPVIGLTGCDRSNTVTYIARRTDAVVDLIEDSTKFQENFKVSVYQGMSGPAYVKKGEMVTVIPNYADEDSSSDINNKIEQNSQNGDVSSPYVKLRMVYDAVWGYSFKIVCQNNEIMNNVIKTGGITKEAQTAINQLDGVINAFRSEVVKQEKELNNLKLYLYDVGESKWETSPAYNAVYNYEKNYKNFVRSGLNLAMATTEVVEKVYQSMNYIELIPGTEDEEDDTIIADGEEETTLTKKLSVKKALNILDMYYTFLVDQNVSNVSGTGDYIDFYNETYRDYLDFIASLYKGVSNEANYANRLKGIQISRLNSQEEVVLNQFKETQTVLNRLDLKTLVVTHKGDSTKLTEAEQRDVKRLNVFYNDILRTWWENAVTTIFSTGVIN